MDLSERTSNIARHPWEVARAQFFVDLMKKHPGARILDVGAGDAYVGAAIVKALPGVEVVAWDNAYSDEEIAELSYERHTATREKPRGEFDIALLLDVLEHVSDDRALLMEAAALLRPAGLVIVSVPAWPLLMSAHDMQLRHRRRYTPDACRAAIDAAGLDVIRSGGLFHTLLAPRALSVVLSNTLLVPILDGANGVNSWRGGPALTSLVTGALRVDTALSRVFATAKLDVPGLSFWAMCRKRR